VNTNQHHIVYILGSRESYNACIDMTETTTNTHVVYIIGSWVGEFTLQRDWWLFKLEVQSIALRVR